MGLTTYQLVQDFFHQQYGEYMSNTPLFTGFEDVLSIEHGGFSSQLC